MRGKIEKIRFAKDKIEINGRTILYSHLQDEAFWEKWDKVAEEYNANTPIDNSMFWLFYGPLLSMELFLQKHKNANIRVDHNIGIKKQLLIKNAFRKNHSCDEDTSIQIVWKVLFWLLSKFKILLSICYLILSQLSQREKKIVIEKDANICIFRTNAAKNKVVIDSKCVVLYESMTGFGPIYAQFSRCERLKMLVQSISKGTKYINNLKKFCEINDMQEVGMLAVSFFSIRIIHICFWGQIMDSLLHNTTGKLITGNIMDGYAFMEYRAGERNSNDIIVYPHGIFGIVKMPGPINGNKFYVETADAAIICNAFYDTNKFIFDEQVSKKMFTHTYTLLKQNKLVYFTGGLDEQVDIQIIKELLKFTIKEKIELYVKFHPNDNRKKFYELNDEVTVIESFTNAICGNICVARMSTVLVEAIYNNSKAISFIVNNFDKNTVKRYPALQSKKIYKVYSLNEFINIYNKVRNI